MSPGGALRFRDFFPENNLTELVSDGLLLKRGRDLCLVHLLKGGGKELCHD
jgi:hypothetical protein